MRFAGAYRELLSERDCRRLAVAAIATRLPTGMLNLALLLAVDAVRGTFASAAITWTSYTLAYAVFQLLTSRFVDRGNARLVLLCSLLVNMASYAMLVATLTARDPTVIFVACTAVLGASTPPAGPMVRSKWPAVVRPELLPTAYAVDAVITEATYIVGPLVVSVIIAFAPATAALVVAAFCTLAGGGLLLASPVAAVAARAGQQSAEEATAAGPAAGAPGKAASPDGARRAGRPSRSLIRSRGVLTVLAMVGFHIFASGAMAVALVAIATNDHARGAAGALLAVLSAGVVAGGLTFGARSWPGRRKDQLVVCYTLTALGLAAASLSTELLILGLIMIVVGVVGGAIDTLLQLALGDVAPASRRTEAFAWLSTVMWASSGAGTATGGELVSIGSYGTKVALLVAAAAMVVAALWALQIPRTSAQAISHTPAPAPEATS